MRMFMRVTFPHDSFNAALKDGTASAKMQKILADLKPESAYFVEMAGKRTGLIFFHMEDQSKIPAVSEPWFLTFGADVELRPAMTPEDLGQRKPSTPSRKVGVNKTPTLHLPVPCLAGGRGSPFLYARPACSDNQVLVLPTEFATANSRPEKLFPRPELDTPICRE